MKAALKKEFVMTLKETKAGIFMRLDTVIVRVRGLERAKAWYREVLELTPGFEAEHVVVFDTGGPTSLTIEDPGPEALERLAPGTARSYPIFYADDIERVHGLLGSRGVKLEPIKSDGMVQYFEFEDLEGNFFNVCHF